MIKKETPAGFCMNLAGVLCVYGEYKNSSKDEEFFIILLIKETPLGGHRKFLSNKYCCVNGGVYVWKRKN